MEIEPAEETVAIVNIPAASVTRVATRDRQHWSTVMRVRENLLLKFLGEYLLISCALAVSMDPLFLYIPLIDEDLKCLRLDSKLRTAALFFRGLTDVHYLLSYCCITAITLYKRNERSTGRTTKKMWLYFCTNIIAILPIPQMVILLALPKMRGMDSHLRMFLNSLVVIQYIPRVLRIYELRKGVNPNTKFQYFHSRTWVGGGLFMFFVLILASHILGAFWYYFSIQRNIDCWLVACTRENQCQFGILKCPRDNSTKNITLLNDLCPINLPNAKIFNFGIFLDALQPGILNSTDFLRKFLHCFWWGLRNLSSFGQNLQTSSYAWENLFAVLICMIGMLLVLVYFNAILQKYMQMEAKKSMLLEITENRATDIETWLCVNDLSGELKANIMGYVLDQLKPDEVVNNVKVLSVLPWQLSLEIKKNLCLDMLRKVPMFNAGGERSLESICGYLKPVIYTENSFILQEGDPVDKMLFITQGVAFIYRTNSDGSGSSNTSSISKGDHYGEQLLNLAPDDDLLSLPRSNWNVKCSTNVEAFFLMAEDLRKIKIDLVESGLI